MPELTDTVPQNKYPISIYTFKDVIDKLPDKLNYPLNIWIGGRLARYGQTSDALAFLVEQDEEPSTELRIYFEKLLDPIPATVLNNWRDEKILAVRLYNEGRLIIDRNTLTYTELPSPTAHPPILKVDEVLAKLPRNIHWKETVYLTGSLVRYGWSGNDVDFMVDTDNLATFKEMRNYFSNILGVKVDVGNTDMPEREPVYKFKLYEGGLWQL